jgi:hypothetical protein
MVFTSHKTRVSILLVTAATFAAATIIGAVQVAGDRLGL